jgi:hypothetical protein
MIMSCWGQKSAQRWKAAELNQNGSNANTDVAARCSLDIYTGPLLVFPNGPIDGCGNAAVDLRVADME